MSSSSMCQTVYDTVRTVVYDTVHTSVFDTVHTVSFDTVHSLVYDSASVTLQALRDSQTFYSNHFIALITVASVAVAVFIFVATKMWDRKVELEVDKLKKDCEKISEETVNKTLKNAEINFRTVAQKELASMKKESIELLKKEVYSKYEILKQAREPLLVLSELSSLLNKIKYDIDDELLDFIISNIFPRIEWGLNEAEKLGFSDGSGSFLLGIKEKFGWFATALPSISVGAEKKNNVVKIVNELDSKLTKMLDEIFNINRGEPTRQSGRYHIQKKEMKTR